MPSISLYLLMISSALIIVSLTVILVYFPLADSFVVITEVSENFDCTNASLLLSDGIINLNIYTIGQFVVRLSSLLKLSNGSFVSIFQRLQTIVNEQPGINSNYYFNISNMIVINLDQFK
jgi:hypothetical protein